jgi:hypothetical protein
MIALNKKTIIYTAIAVILVVAVSIGTVFALATINKDSSSKDSSTPSKTTVNDLRKQADKAIKSNDATKAKELLLEAQKQNDELPKSDTTTNTKVDIDAQLYLLEHAK